MTEHVIDSNDVCSMVLVKLLRIWRTATPGDVVIVRTPWEGAASELGKWCNETGNKVLSVDKDGSKYVVKMRLESRFN
jgi:TusA-related sulfurtransferase